MDASDTHLQAKLVESIVGKVLEAVDDADIGIRSVDVVKDDSLSRLAGVWVVVVLSLVVAHNGLKQQHRKYENVQLKKNK